jgi:arylsulfatase A-like enzyme
MRDLVRLLIPALVCFFVLSLRETAAQSRPNVIVILTDDQGWGDLSLHGNTNLETPRIDSLARDGVALDRFYVCPVCAPTRAEFLTGRYHPRGGVRGVSTGQERLNLDEHTIAQSFQAGGYVTAAFGKWHNGTQYPYHPRARGFDEYYGFTSGHWGHYFAPLMDHNGVLVRGNGYIIDDLTDHALRFIERNAKRSFFCYIPYNTPHSPFQVPEKWFSKFRDAPIAMRNRDPDKEELDKTRCALAMCENIDWNVGRILDTLDTLQLAENTIVVYFSDNGPNTWRWNGGMKGRKGSTDEGGVRSPCFLRWPGGNFLRGQTVPQIAGAIDLMPTLLDLCGLPAVGNQPLDGISLRPLLVGTAENWPERTLFSHWNRRFSARTDRFRLDTNGELFDMLADPEQKTNVAGQHPEEARRLTERLEAWKQEVFGEEPPEDDRPFPVGYAGAPETQLPARDGRFSGNVQRSGRAPNCSYFLNWTSTEDRIWWDVEVLEPGTYDVVIHYTCDPENIGAEIELSLGESTLKTVVKSAHEPPVYGLEADRADRGSESFVRDFREWGAGSIVLPRTTGKLTLQATRIPGSGVIEVRMLTLRPH